MVRALPDELTEHPVRNPFNKYILKAGESGQLYALFVKNPQT